MDERDVVELRLRLPAGELGTLARLMEQARSLLTLEGGGAADPAPARTAERPMEAGVNTAFDAGKFRRIGEARRAEAGGEARRAEAGGEASPPEAEAAGAPAETDPDDIVPPEAGLWDAPDAATVEAEVRSELPVPAVEAAVSLGPETPAGTADAIERPEAEPASSRREERTPELAVPLPAAPEVRRGLAEVRDAGFTPETTPAEARGGAFAAVEELVGPGPAPLTAESVALAFQRDDRRYDNGFPLY